MSNKLLFSLSGTLLATVVALIALWPYLKLIGFLLAILSALLTAFGLWHICQMKTLQRQYLRAEVSQIKSLVWQEEQTLLGQQELEREKIRLEYDLKLKEFLWKSQAHIIPSNHTAIFPQTDGSYYLPVVAQRQQHLISQVSEEEHDDRQMLPTNITYNQIRHQIPTGRVLVGVGRSGIETREQEVGACVWIVGLSGTGKTSTTVLRVEERVTVGHQMLGIDPHFFKPDSLSNAVVPYVSQFIKPMARSTEETREILDLFMSEFQARKAGLRGAGPWQPITILVDEVGSLVDTIDQAEKENADLLKRIARICGQESRNFDMGGIFVSQQATNLAWLRKCALMIIVHQLLMDSEKKLALNGDTAAMEDMKTWPIGRTYVYGVGFQSGPLTVQQPFFKPDETMDGNQQGNGLETHAQASGRIIENAFPPFPLQGSLRSEKEVETGNAIRALKAEGKTDREISAHLGLTGRKYKLYQDYCRQIDEENMIIESERI